MIAAEPSENIVSDDEVIGCDPTISFHVSDVFGVP